MTFEDLKKPLKMKDGKACLMNRRYVNFKSNYKVRLMRLANSIKTLLKHKKNINSQLNKSKNSDKKWKENVEPPWQRMNM